MEGYEAVRADRATRGGGVCWYLKQPVKWKLLDVDFLCGEHLEQLWIQVNIGGHSLALCAVYRPPGSPVTALNELEGVLHHVYLCYDELVVVGDINIDLLKRDNPFSCQLVDVLSQVNLVQIVTEPTRCSDNSSSLIDIICIDKRSNRIQCINIDVLNETDHMMVWCELDMHLPASSPSSVTCRDFGRFCRNDFEKDCALVGWGGVEHIEAIDDKIAFINSAVLSLYNVHASVRTIKIKRKYQPYFTENIKRLIKLKNNAYKRYRLSRCDAHSQYYKQLKNFLSTAIKNEKAAYIRYRVNVCNKNPRRLWRALEDLSIHKKPTEIIPEHLKDVNMINAEICCSRHRGYAAYTGVF